MKKTITLLPLLLMIAACTQSAPPADPAVITSRSDAWEEALNARDIDALVGIYTSDARIMPPDGQMASGSDAVRAVFGGMIEAGVSGELTSVEAAVAGDIGYNVGTFTLTAGDSVSTGKFAEIWHRGNDGQWHIATDIWNNDAPMHAKQGPKTHLMITHEVDDADKWLAAWRGEDSRHELFKANGAAHVHAFQNADNPNLTGLVVAVSDLEGLQAMLGSEEGMAAAAEDGVKSDTLKVLMQAD